MKRGLIIIAILISLISFLPEITASESWMPSNFSILGCKMNNELLLYESCSRYGLFWCDQYGKLQDVFRVPNACRGKNKQAGFPEDDCCPPNYYCNYNTNLCELREYECSKFTSKDPCELNGCIWFEKTLENYICIDRRQLISCSDYQRNSTCSRDLYNLGKTNGLGTEVCKGFYVGTKLVVSDSCQCSWEGINETSGNCTLNYKVIDEFDPYKDFLCKKQFSLSNCTDGKQNISWVVHGTSQGLYLSQEYLIKFNCQPGEKVVSCGYSFTKLPFFSLTNIIIAVIIIIIFYIYIYKKTK